jgi:ABC-type multidrug transport system fused ATPase/permease subunit
MIALLRQLFAHVSAKRRHELVPVIGMMLLGALAELVSIGAVLPFLAVAADPERALGATGAFGAWLEGAGLNTSRSIIIAAALAFAAAALIAMAVRLFLIAVIQRYVLGLAKEISVAVYSRTLYQPYAYHTSLNSSETLAAVNKAQLITSQVLTPLMQAASAVVIASFILIGLVVIDPVVAVASGVGFGAVYLVVIMTTRKIMRRQGQVVARAQGERLQSVSEGLGGIRDVILDRLQPIFLERFETVETRLRRAQMINSFIGQSPRFVVEGLGTVLIAVLALALSAREGGLIAALPVLGALALGAQRLLPLMQQIYVGWASFVGNGKMLEDILDILRLPEAPQFKVEHDDRKLPFTRVIELENVSFSYPLGNRPALESISLSIPKGMRVGFAGRTGSGKSTLMDIVLGLLHPDSGRILVDGVELTDENRSAWQAQIAHVPQVIYLADVNVAQNIAFGVPAGEIDMGRVRRCAEQAELADVIEALPQGYDTLVGERGIRLSGGQRQRIGIARALYKQASVLVFDEATSALDNETEAAVMTAIDGLSKDLTILIIAHRLSTLENCDMIVQLQAGKFESVTGPAALKSSGQR